MQAGEKTERRGSTWGERCGQGIAGLLLLASLWPLAFGGAGRLDDPSSLGLDELDAGGLFFEPHQPSPALILLVAAFLLWRRLDRWAGLPDARAWPAASLSLGLAFGFAVWGQLNAAVDQRVFALILGGLGLALWTKGRAGAHTIAVPLCALLFAVPVPGWLSNHLVWSLQLVSAWGAEALLGLAGFEVVRHGIFIERGEAGFLVIESCSGFRSMHTLTLLSIVIGDLFDLRRRTLVLVAAAPFVAHALNVLRIVWIVVANQDPAAADDHLGQGLVVLVGGVLLVFVLGLRLAGGAWARPDEQAGSTRIDASRFSSPWRVVAGLALFASIPVWVPQWPLPLAASRLELGGFESRERWVAEPLDVDRMFLGGVGIGRVQARRLTYEGSMSISPGPVDVFVGVESVSFPRRSPFTPLLRIPSREFEVERVERGRDLRLSVDFEETRARWREQRFLVRTWRAHDEGAAREVLRSVFAAVRGPFARARPRVVFRVATPIIGSDPRAADWARDRLQTFLIDYRADLAISAGD